MSLFTLKNAKTIDEAFGSSMPQNVFLFLSTTKMSDFKCSECNEGSKRYCMFHSEKLLGKRMKEKSKIYLCMSNMKKSSSPFTYIAVL